LGKEIVAGQAHSTMPVVAVVAAEPLEAMQPAAWVVLVALAVFLLLTVHHTPVKLVEAKPASLHVALEVLVVVVQAEEALLELVRQER